MWLRRRRKSILSNPSCNSFVLSVPKLLCRKKRIHTEKSFCVTEALENDPSMIEVNGVLVVLIFNQSNYGDEKKLMKIASN